MKNFSWTLLLAFALILLSPKAHAFITDLNFFYYSDSFKIASATTQSRIFGDLAIGVDLDKKGRFYVAWNIGYVSAADTDAATSTNTTFSVLEMGPKLGYFLDKDKIWSLALTYNYNLLVIGTYSNGGTAETWRGSSIKFELGYTPQVSESFWVGVKLIYHSQSFNEKIVGSSDYTQVAYTRAMIYPALNLSWRF
jgi:hypothetical protein